MKNLFLLFVCLISTSSLFAQKVFEGHINYSMKLLGEGVDAYAALMPTSMDLYSSKKALMVKINGGMMESTMGETVSTPKGSYIIKHGEETIYTFSADAEENKENPTVVKENEVLTISGLSCQKYKVIKDSPTGEQTTYAWINSDYILPVMGAKGAESMAIPGVPGIVLKTMVSQGPVTIVLTAGEIKTGKQDKKLFAIPKGYAKKEYVPTGMGY